MWTASFVGHGKYIKVSVLLIHEELQSLGRLCCVVVLEPNWHVMHNRLQTAKSIDEVIQYHDFFLEKCLRECLLLSPELLKKVEKLKSICLQKFEREFNSELQNLGPILSKSSQAEPYLTHLAQWILGAGRDQ
ncbi:hypothetical protein TEA_028071 [Camellia sinensis var. sinensis]|uniref:Gamma-tubulin complex component n=1 Tax=Camellia sinensis var. sinensis TaxID=542762 RepID=A0A4S4EXV8_CAMSN|nr:hypothetical protein TEA_028071 [Camellia sinensis var. sinensis]